MDNTKFSIGVVAAVFVAFMALLFSIALADRERSQQQFEQCIAAGMQWNNGDCLK